MNATIKKTINGKQVEARPVFKGGAQPAYWEATVNRHSIPQVFTTPADIFRMAAAGRDS